MSDVFISWGSPDRTAVERLRERLRDIGLEFFEYSEDMNAGERIPSRVARAIREASVGIVCLSGESAQREWILTEVAWLDQALEDGRLAAIVPVQVGPLTETPVPQLIRMRGLDVLDVTRPDGIERLIRAVHQHLGQKGRIVLPALLFAMTTGQFDELSHTPGIRQPLLDACRYLGLNDPALLRQRYGERPEDFSPFAPGVPLISTIRGALRQLNARRIQEDEKPIFDRWLNADIFGKDIFRQNEARRLWLRQSSLLIVDSLSAGHPDVRDQLRDLSYQLDRMAVIWIPPYTQRTAELQASLAEDFGIVRQLGDFFREWADRSRGSEHPILWGAFDVDTDLALWHWLYRMCGALVHVRADDRARNEMESNFGVPIRPGNFYSPRPS